MKHTPKKLDRGDYFQNKELGLQRQFNQEGIAVESDIFRGVVVYVDGHTDPPLAEIKKLVRNHGGYVSNMPFTNVTIYVASHIPHAKFLKLNKLRKMSKRSYVTPAWILDSIAARRKLPIGSYLLASTVDKSLQRQMRTAIAGSGVMAGAIDPVGSDGMGEREVPCDDSAELPAFIVDSGMSNASGTYVDAEEGDLPLDDGENSSDHDEALMLVGGEVSSSSVATSRLIAPVCAEESPESMQRRGNSGKSSKDNPNFVEDFFKTSRLHLMGTSRQFLQELRALQGRKLPVTNSATGSVTGRIKGRFPQTLVAHIDMDCFFASVSLLKRPDLVDQPVAVAHGDTAGSEISSCNYVARQYGIKAGMWVAQAKELMRSAKRVDESSDEHREDDDAAPSAPPIPGRLESLLRARHDDAKGTTPSTETATRLHILPYDFDNIRAISHKVYSIFYKYFSMVQIKSCDEAVIDISDLDDPVGVVQKVRAEIYESTGCTASAGLGSNMLLAKLATKRAKPNGLYWLRDKDILEFMSSLKPSDIPQLGHARRALLNEAGYATVKEMQSLTKSQLGRIIGGDKLAQKLYDALRGIDDTLVTDVIAEPKAISVCISWGVRFDLESQVKHFITKLLAELTHRMELQRMSGRSFTLTIFKRHPEAPVIAPKHLGCGRTTQHRRVVNFAVPVRTVESVVERLYKEHVQLAIEPVEIRGVSISATKLVADHSSSSGSSRIAASMPKLTSFFKASSEVTHTSGEGKAVVAVDAAASASIQVDADGWQVLPMHVKDHVRPAAHSSKVESKGFDFPEAVLVEDDVSEVAALPSAARPMSLSQLTPTDISEDMLELYDKEERTRVMELLLRNREDKRTLAVLRAEGHELVPSLGESKRDGHRHEASKQELRDPPARSPLTFTQIDAEVWSELPAHIKAEVEASISLGYSGAVETAATGITKASSSSSSAHPSSTSTSVGSNVGQGGSLKSGNVVIGKKRTRAKGPRHHEVPLQRIDSLTELEKASLIRSHGLDYDEVSILPTQFRQDIVSDLRAGDEAKKRLMVSGVGSSMSLDIARPEALPSILHGDEGVSEIALERRSLPNKRKRIFKFEPFTDETRTKIQKHFDSVKDPKPQHLESLKAFACQLIEDREFADVILFVRWCQRVAQISSQWKLQVIDLKSYVEDLYMNVMNGSLRI